MTKRKSTKRALLLSALSLLVCVSMLVGSTFAWFTDSVTSAGNKIQAGTLKVDLELLDKDGKWKSIKESNAPIFNYDKWEPGYTDVKILKVENEGNLALKWYAKFVSANEISILADVIDVYVLPSETTELAYPADRNLDGYTKVGTLRQFLNSIETSTYGSLEPGKSAYLGIGLKMQESAGNEYQDKTIGAFDIQILATQYTYEKDSFGMDYDVNAEYPEVSTVKHNPAAPSTLSTEDVVVTLDANAEEGVYELEVTNKKKEVAADGTITVSYDINLLLDGVKVTNNGTTMYEVAIKIGTGADIAKVLHNSVEVTNYTYDNGFVVFETASFSPFSVVYTTIDKWDGKADVSWYSEGATSFELDSAEDLAGLAKLVNEEKMEFVGKTVKLTTDVDLSGYNFMPIGGVDKGVAFQGTFDGGNNTIKGLTQNGWDLGYKYGQSAGMGLFGWIGNATIQNLTIDGAEISMEAVVMGTVAGYAGGDCTFKNIDITNSKVANYNWDTGGIVGQVYGDGNKFVFEDINVAETTTISGHWGTWDVSAGGVVGRTADGVTVSMKDVNVACVLDVYNDACAAYQWFAYRYSGMLVGYTKTTETVDGRTVATAPHVTCENVTVTYGDWMNYTYCQPSNVSPQYVRVQGGYSTDPYYSGRHWTAGVDANGNKMVDDNHAHTEGQAHNKLLPFDQLFGGGQGVYGTATHNGVTVVYPNN